MLPDGWSDISLGDAFSFKNGLNGDKELYGAGTKFVNVMDVFRGPRLRVSEIVGSMKISPKQLSAYAVQYGDVLFNRTSETHDEIALATVYFDTAPAVFGGFVIRGRPTSDDTLPEFCVYGFQSAAMRRAMIRLGQGAIRANIGQGDLSKVKWALPPLPEQRRIAEILSTWDRAIETVEALIANASAQKKALMQSLLTAKKRLPGFSGIWDVTSLGQIGETFGGLTGKSKANFGSGSPFITYKNVFENPVVDPDNVQLVDVKSGERQHVVRYGDILFTTSSETPVDVGMSSVVMFEPGIMYLNSFCFGFRTSNPETILPNFAAHFFRSDEMRTKIASLAQGSTRYNISKTQLLKLNFRLPQALEQRAIADVLDVAQNEIARLASQLTALRQEKSALMQQLLTGKRRVKLDKKEAA